MAGATNVMLLAEQVQRHPYRSLLLAAGVGYVLGGGLFTRFTMNALRIGVRVGGLPLLQRELLGAAQAAFAGPTTPTS